MQITKLGNPSHGDLPGLGDDDHTQYLLADGSRHAASLIIDGDLTVSGSTVTMDVTNMTVEDNIVVLNQGETASGVTLGTAGIQIDRGLLTDAQLLWNETTDVWQVGTVGSLLNIVTSSGAALQHDELGGLSDDDHTQYYNSGRLTTWWGTASGTIDHNTIVNTHNLTTDIDHDQLTNFASDEHFTWASVSGSIDHNTIVNTHNLTTDIDHGTLTGVGDDDHTMYARVNGSRNFTGQETFESNVIIQGNLIVSGTEFITETETVQIEDNLMVINYGEVGAGVTAGEAGIEVDRGSSANYRFMFDEVLDAFVVGVSGSEQPVATREESASMTASGIPYWDGTDIRFETVAGFIYTGGNARVPAAAPLNAADLTRKDYVDGVLSTHISADDHAQYLLADGTREVTGAMIMQSGLTVSGILEVENLTGITIGQFDALRGGLTFYGDSDGNSGGILRWHIPFNYDTTDQDWEMTTSEDDMMFGPATDADAFKWTAEGDFNVTAGNVTSLEPTASGHLTSKYYVDTISGVLAANALQNINEDLTPQLGGDLDIGAFEIILDPTPASDDTGSGFKVTVTVSGNASGVGAAMYQDTSGDYREADASAGTTMPCKGIALETGTGSKEIMKLGYVRNDGWNFTSIGQPVYVSESTGAFTQTAPTTSGSFVQAVGTAESADVLDFNPDWTMVEVTA
jgi:hypothetical protein